MTKMLKNKFTDILTDDKSGSLKIGEKTLNLLEDCLNNKKRELADYFLRIIHENFKSMAVIKKIYHELSQNYDLNKITELKEKINSNQFLQNYNDLFKNKITIMTISNSSSIIELLKQQSESVKNVYCLHSLPGGEGIELMKQLHSNEMKAEVIDDFEASTYIQNVDLCLIGADLVTDEFVINKIGSLQLALLAKFYEKKIVAVFNDLKYISSDKLENLEIDYLFEKIPTNLIDTLS